MEVTDFLENGKFKCMACGACCSFITPLVKRGKLPKKWLRPDGSCKNLKDKKCVIYALRPNICRIKETVGKTSSDIQIATMCKIMHDNLTEFKGD